MKEILKIRVLSEDAVIFEGECDMVLLPTASGQVGVMVRYAPHFYKIVAGDIIIKSSKGEKTLKVSGGFCSVLNSIVTVCDRVDGEASEFCEEEYENFSSE